MIADLNNTTAQQLAKSVLQVEKVAKQIYYRPNSVV